MGILIIEDYGKEKREYPIVVDEVRIGRDPGREIVLEDIGVSRAHARIVREDEDYFLDDLGSRNGTVVNDRRIPPRGRFLLRHGDIIRLGRSVVRFLVRISRKITAGLLGAMGTAEGSAAGERDGRPCLFRLQKIEALLIVASGGAVVRHRLGSDLVRIGRSPRSQIVLDDPSVSEDHAEIVYNREGFFLVDRDSAGGVHVGGIAARVSRLATRSFILIGRVQALFIVAEAGSHPPEPSFALRDHLVDLFPERAADIREVFQDCRQVARDFAEELVVRRALTPEEWWAATRDFREARPGGLWRRIFELLWNPRRTRADRRESER